MNLILKNINSSIIRQAESEESVCVCVNSIISVFIIIFSRTISCTCLDSDFTLQARTVATLSEIVFLFVVENKSFCFRR